jgi:enoyl-CoA hydratase/carnithine racemase
MNKPATAREVAQGSPLSTSIDGGVARLTLDRPRQSNAISIEMLDALEAALRDVAANRDVRVVVVAGNGPAFSGGHDLKQMMQHRDEDFVGALFETCSRVMLALRALPQPVIARVHGIATAAGCQLVAACDLAVASTEARFATSGINLGLYRVVAPEALDDEVARLARLVCDKPPAVIAAGKALFYDQLEARLDRAYELASRSITCNMLGAEAAEGVAAFLEKRKPNWS